jgi:peptidoglycan/LPS O-acetylase OafA/YrhL
MESGDAAAEDRNHARAFRADIQGLRAIAVLSVVLYHANPNWMPGGFVGVDIFFVISGYLIAGILMGELERKQYSLVGFYERRVRRLFPALFVMLAYAAAAGALLLPPDAYNGFAKDAFATIFFVSNVTYYFQAGYFDPEAQLKPLLHTWSLAVEEQFYLLFPPLLAGLYAIARKRVRLVLAMLALASLLACEAAVQRNEPAAFFLAPFRAFELLLGAVLARLAFADWSQRWRDGLSLLGLVLIAIGLFGLSEQSVFPGVSALLPCLGAAALLCAGAGGSSAGGRIVSGPFFNFFGSISYSLYLWHWPVLVFARYALVAPPTPLQTALLIGLAVLAATASYFLVERRFLARRGRPRLAIGVGLGVMGAAAAASFAIARLDGLPQRFRPEALALFASAEDFSPKRLACHNFLIDILPYERACVLGASAVEPTWAVWGDSHGVELAYALSERLEARGLSLLQLTASGCPPALGFDLTRRPICDAQNRLLLEKLRADSRIGTVVFAVNFMGNVYPDQTLLLAHFTEAVEAIARIGRRVVIVAPIPVFDFEAPAAIGLIAQRGGDPSQFGLSRSEYDRATSEARQTISRLARRTGAMVVRTDEIFCDQARCRAHTPERGAMYFNLDHPSLAGARPVAQQIERQVFMQGSDTGS